MSFARFRGGGYWPALNFWMFWSERPFSPKRIRDPNPQPNPLMDRAAVKVEEPKITLARNWTVADIAPPSSKSGVVVEVMPAASPNDEIIHVSEKTRKSAELNWRTRESFSKFFRA